MKYTDMGLCDDDCCSNESDKVLQHIKQYESLLKESYVAYSPDDQAGFFKWACLTVRSAVRLLSFYNLPPDHFEEVLVLSLQSLYPCPRKDSAKTEAMI